MKLSNSPHNRVVLLRCGCTGISRACKNEKNEKAVTKKKVNFIKYVYRKIRSKKSTQT